MHNDNYVPLGNKEMIGLNNNTKNIHVKLKPNQNYAEIVALVISSIVFTIGVPGNILVILTICRTKKMRTIQNIFMGNLAVGDLLSIIWCLPSFVLPLFIPWPFPVSFVCKYIYPLNHVITVNTVFMMVCIMLNRYRAIVHPLKQKLRFYITFLIIITIWVISYLLIGLPSALFSSELSIICWGKRRFDTAWKNTLTMFQRTTILIISFCFPCIITLFCVARIKSALQKNLNYANSVINNEAVLKRAKAHQKRIKLVMGVTVSFFICFLPFNTLLIISLFDGSFITSDYYVLIVYYYSFILIYTNSAINPVILYALSKDFKKGYLRQLKCIVWHTRKVVPLNQEHLEVGPGAQIPNKSSRNQILGEPE